MAFCPGTASWRVRIGKGSRTSPRREGLVDGHEAMKGATNAKITIRGRGIYKKYELVLVLINVKYMRIFFLLQNKRLTSNGPDHGATLLTAEATQLA